LTTVILLPLILLAAGCSDDGAEPLPTGPTATPTATATPTTPQNVIQVFPGGNDQENLLTALIEAQPGDLIQLEEGTYHLTGQLSLDVDDVTMRGRGMDKTILSFAGQETGAEGLLVTGDRFLIEDLALEDSPGDLLKVVGCEGLTIRRVRAEWTNGPATTNGAYGFYPVECTDVLVEESVVKGASDAGFYVGQCHRVIVRRNLAQFNVAGIEIENSTDADVYENLAINNAGGILVFNLPGLPFIDGRRTRVFHNDIHENNTENFAAPGTTVSGVPTGTGLMILANDQVEVFENDFRRNDTSQILLISFRTAEVASGAVSTDPRYDKFSETLYILDNEYADGGENPDSGTADLIGGIVGGLPFPDILYDGDTDRRKLVDDMLPDSLRLCIQENNARFFNVNLPMLGANASDDLEPYDCTHERLPEVVIAGVGEPTGPRPTPENTPMPTSTPVPGRLIEIAPSENDQDTLLTALIEAQPHDVIQLAAGTYHLTGQLSLDVDDVTLRGAGIDATLLSFAGQTTGAEGLLVNADRFVIEDLAMVDSPGDLLKVVGCDGLIIRRVRTEWTNGPDTDNGSYGLYPVECRNVLIEDSIVRGASDAGFYVGQSHNVVVRRNLAEFNVAGIEIENSTDADVYENTATANAGGILVFNLPGLPFVDGRRTRVFDNQVYENNTPNFAPSGTSVSAVPTGTGMMVLANDQVEVFDNTFRDNDTTHVLLIGFHTAAIVGGFVSRDPNYDLYSEGVYITGNSYEGGGASPEPSVAQLIGGIVGSPFPNILSDGDEDRRKFVDGALPDDLRLCIQEQNATFYDIDLPNVGTNASPDLEPFDCSHERLPAVIIPGVTD
jgi:parallel beta-helix repeat protein